MSARYPRPSSHVAHVRAEDRWRCSMRATLSGITTPTPSSVPLAWVVAYSDALRCLMSTTHSICHQEERRCDMTKNRYGRFWLALNKLYKADECVKQQLVHQYTEGRTVSLREMSDAEYNAMCDALERKVADDAREVLRKARSSALHHMQRLGIDTTNWSRVNAFCRDSRIAGKEFGVMNANELNELVKKLRGIERKGGLKSNKAEPTVVLINLDPDKIAIE